MDTQMGFNGASSTNRKLWVVLVLVFILVGAVGVVAWSLLRPMGTADTPKATPQQTQTSPAKPTQPAGKPQEVAIDGVTAGQTLQGKVTIQATISEPGRVQRVEYYIDGVFAGVTYAAPFSFIVDTVTLTAGEHTITAKVFNTDGSSTDSPAITIVVAQPTVAAGAPSSATKSSSSSGSVAQQASTSQTSQESDDDATEDAPPPPAAPDTTAPSTPSGLMLSADDGYTVNISWSASSDNVGVTGYRVFRDGSLLGTTASLSYQDQTVVPGNTYEYAVKALDNADNISGLSNEPSITLAETSIWINADSPQTITSDPDSYELGVKFRPLVNGKVTGVKFYKGSGNTGTHIGNLWQGNGTHLASVTFTGETSSGWQLATFSTPVDVTAGTTYVVSYSAPNGHYSSSSQYFATDGITSQYLTAMASGVDGNNGVFSEDLGQFPSTSFQNANYWVDVTFTPNANASGPSVIAQDNSKIYSGFPGSNNTGVPAGKRLPSRDRGIIAYQPAVIENIHITGEVEARAANVVIRKSKINGFVYLDTDDPGAGSWSMTIEDSEVAAGNVIFAAVRQGNMTITRSNIHGGQHSVNCGGSCTITDSWLHGQYVFTSPSDSHNNAFLSNGGSNMTISGSTLSCDVPIVGSAGCSGDLSLFGDFAPVTNVAVTGNLFVASDQLPFCMFAGYQSGKTYGLDADNIDVTNNTFQRGTTGMCGTNGPVTNYLLDGLGTPPPNSSWLNNKWGDGSALTQ